MSSDSTSENRNINPEFNSIHYESTCIFCPDFNDYIGLLPIHMLQHISIKQFTDPSFCIHCLRYYLNPKNFADHVIEATEKEIYLVSEDQWQMETDDEKIYRCKYCQFGSASYKKLIIHLDENHFVVSCPYCLESFNLHYYAQQDPKDHLNPYSRHFVLESFSLYEHLQQHFDSGDTNACHLCQLCFVSQDELLHHLVVIHNSLRDKSGSLKKRKNILSNKNQRKIKNKSQIFKQNKEQDLSLLDNHKEENQSLIYIQGNLLRSMVNETKDVQRFLDERESKNDCPMSQFKHIRKVYLDREEIDPRLKNFRLFSKHSDPQSINDFNLTKVIQESTQYAKLCNSQYSFKEEIDEISKEFPNDQYPFYINVCMQCCISFKNFRYAAEHCLAMNDDPGLGLVIGTPQSHIIYRRSLVRIFRFEDPMVKKNIHRAYIQELIQYHQNVEQIRTMFRSKKLKRKLERNSNMNSNVPVKKMALDKSHLEANDHIKIDGDNDTNDSDNQQSLDVIVENQLNWKKTMLKQYFTNDENSF